MSEETEKLSSNQQAIRKQHRSIVGTSFLLLMILILAMYLKIVEPPFAYLLFSLIFIVDFAAECYVIWKHKVYWVGKNRYLEGGLAQVIAVAYGFLSLVCLALAINLVQVYYF